MRPNGRLSGKVALITGAGSGIGRETAVRFAQEGATVACADIDPRTAAATASAIGASAFPIEIDITSPKSVQAGVDAAAARGGGLDSVINNAAINIVGAVHDLNEDDWDKGLATNLKSIYLMSKAAWPHLKARGGGSLTQAASIAGIQAMPDNAAYCASKAGVVMLTKCLALDGARDGIRANCVCPGFTETPMLASYYADQPDPAAARALTEKQHPLGRLGKPRDIADAYVYLASDEAAWVTGAALVVDGGLISGLWSG